MLKYKWFWMGTTRRHRIIDDGTGIGRCVPLDDYHRMVIYLESDREFLNIEDCVRDAEQKGRHMDYPDSMGCRLIVEVNGTLSSMDCDDSDCMDVD